MRRPLVLTVFLVLLYIGSVNLCLCSAPIPLAARPNMQEDFTVSDIGSVVYTQHGSKTYLGNDRWLYRSSIGKKNTWNGAEWVRWIYDPDDKSVKVGNLTISHNPDGALTLTGDSGIIVGRLAWYSQYYNGAQWNNVSLDNYAWRGFSVNETHAFAYQQFWGNTGELNITYIYSNQQEFKIIVDVTNKAAQAAPIRLIWGASQIKEAVGNYELLYEEVGGQNVTVGINIDGTRFFWLDVRNYDPAIAINTVLDKPNRRAAVVFGNQSSVLPAGYTYTLDPSFSDDVQADTDDDCYQDPYGSPIHCYSYNIIDFENNSFTIDFRGQVRFALDIPKDASISSADFSGYEVEDDEAQAHTIWRIDETNVGSLEGDSSMPSLDTSIEGNWNSNGDASEWSPLIDVTALVQAQVNLGGWESGYYIGFAFETDEGRPFKDNTFEDYQAAGTNHANITVEYTEGGGDDYYLTVNEVIELFDSTSTILGGGVTINEVIELFDSISTILDGFVTVSEVIPIADSVSALSYIGIVIFEIIPIYDSTSTTVSVFQNIFELIPFFDTVIVELNPVDAIIIYVVIPIDISSVIEGGLEGLNIFYDLFLSASMWGVLGPLGLVVAGYYLTKKEAILGILCWIVICFFIWNYFQLIEAHPAYWVQIFILLFGGLLTCVYPLWAKGR